MNIEGLGTPIIWFVVLFTFAFIALAALYGAAASLGSRQEDLSAASTPIMTLIMLPYFLIIMFASTLYESSVSKMGAAVKWSQALQA